MRAILATIAAVLAAGLALGAHPATPEYRIKAALLLNIARYVEWSREPAQDLGHTLIFGVLGEDPFGETLDLTLRARTIRGRPLRVHRFRTLKELGTCHLLFISSSERDHWDEILQLLKRSSVLTISDEDGFAELGGIANFVIADDSVRLEINPAPAKEAGLVISSQLLKVAKIVPVNQAGKDF